MEDKKIDLAVIVKACEYLNAVCVDSFDDLDAELKAAKEKMN